MMGKKRVVRDSNEGKKRVVRDSNDGEEESG
jgi:hypothetical protein